MNRSRGRLILFLLLVAVAPHTLLGAGPPLPAGPEIRVNRGIAGGYGDPQVAVFRDGGFVVVWTVGPSGIITAACGFPTSAPSFLHARLFHPDGSPASRELQLVRPFGRQAADSVAALADDSFVVVYEQFDDRGRSIVLAARFARDGTRLVPPVRVHAASGLSRYCGQVAADPGNGGFAVAWTGFTFDGPGDTFGHSNAYARRFTAEGVPLGPEILMAQGFSQGGGADVQTGAVAVAGDGSLFVAVTSFGDGISSSVARTDAMGRPVGGIDLHQLSPQTDATLSMAPDGTLAVVWIDVPSCGGFNSPSHVWALRLGADGNPLDTDPLRVNRRGICERQPKVAALAGGGFVALWTDGAGRDGSGAGVFGRTFGADGAPETRDFRVNVTTEGDQTLSAIAANARGDIVAVWVQANSPAQIVARRFSPPGS
ncbi:MAG: hypothetical protein M3O15_14430 [Acidobacteriota bacterium]|nr:hypothetical protein [Acidobacteriota bacterium]